MKAQDSSNASDTAAEQSPWDKFGWVMGAIWLLFLIFPALAVIRDNESLAVRVIGLALVFAYGAIYVVAFIRTGRTNDWSTVNRIGAQHLALMLLVVIAQIPMLGPWVVGFAPFMVALGMFTLPLAIAGGLAVAVSLGVAATAYFTDSMAELGSLVLIILAVSVAAGAVRVLTERSERHEAREDERKLIEERDRMARDVHDVLGHSLTVISVKAELAERLVELDPERATAEIAQIKTLSRQALAEVRATVSGLRIARLGEEIERGRESLEDAGIAADIPTDISEVDPRHRVVLAWVLRELITNVLRHSGASRCVVTFTERGMSVADDGVGLGASEAGNGMRGMRERLRSAGGFVEFADNADTAGDSGDDSGADSGTGAQGTTVTVTFASTAAQEDDRDQGEGPSGGTDDGDLDGEATTDPTGTPEANSGIVVEQGSTTAPHRTAQESEPNHVR